MIITRNFPIIFVSIHHSYYLFFCWVIVIVVADTLGDYNSNALSNNNNSSINNNVSNNNNKKEQDDRKHKGYMHNPYNGVICNDIILATGVFSSKELWKLSKGTCMCFLI